MATGSKQKKASPSYNLADWDGLINHVSSPLQKLTEHQEPAENIWINMKNILLDGARKFIPTKRTKRRARKPWFSSALDQKIELKKRLHKRTKENGGLELEQRYQALKREVQREFRREHNAYVENILTEEECDPSQPNKKFGAYVKQKRSDNSGVGTLRVNSRLITDPTQKAEALNHKFHFVFNPASNPPPSPISLNSDVPDIKVSGYRVLKLLQQLKPNKATGPDELSPRLQKRRQIPAQQLSADQSNMCTQQTNGTHHH